MQSWRLLDTGVAPGSLNMAMDEAILVHISQGKAPPTLRFYAWFPPCLSIGYFQSVEKDIDIQGCRRLGIDLVRRPTGGRAILHEDELTYSIIAPSDNPVVFGGVRQSYRKIAIAISEGFRALGINAVWESQKQLARSQASTGACFEAIWGHELTVGGRKLVASAQMRRDGVTLQHGSIMLAVNIERMLSLLSIPDSERGMARESFSQKVTSVSEALGRSVSRDEVISAIRRGFERALGVVLEEGELDTEEQLLASRLAHEKYGAPGWNLRRPGRAPTG